MTTHIRAVDGQKTWKDYGLDDLRNTNPSLSIQAPHVYEQASSTESALKILEQSLGFTSGVTEIPVKTPLETVTIKQDSLPHLVEKRDNARERYSNYILPTLTNPFEIWETEYNDESTRNRYIGLFTGKTNVAVIVKVQMDGSVMWNMMNADKARMNKFRVGKLLWNK